MPAIALLDRVGSDRLAARLRQAGANLVLLKDETPGLAMGLGGVRVALQERALHCPGLTRLRPTKPLREIIGDKDDARSRCRPVLGLIGRKATSFGRDRKMPLELPRQPR